jgi:hypothetical protein
MNCTMTHESTKVKPDQSAAQAMKKLVIVIHFTKKIIRTYLYITCNKKILVYCEYSPKSPFLFLLSEHKHCYNAATNSNSENARSRIVASLWGSLCMRTKEDESNTLHVFKLMTNFFL